MPREIPIQQVPTYGHRLLNESLDIMVNTVRYERISNLTVYNSKKNLPIALTCYYAKFGGAAVKLSLKNFSLSRSL